MKTFEAVCVFQYVLITTCLSLSLGCHAQDAQTNSKVDKLGKVQTSLETAKELVDEWSGKILKSLARGDDSNGENSDAVMTSFQSITDPWGSALRLKSGSKTNLDQAFYVVEVVSNGPDKRAETSDDISSDLKTDWNGAHVQSAIFEKRVLGDWHDYRNNYRIRFRDPDGTSCRFELFDKAIPATGSQPVMSGTTEFVEVNGKKLWLNEATIVYGQQRRGRPLSYASGPYKFLTNNLIEVSSGFERPTPPVVGFHEVSGSGETLVFGRVLADQTRNPETDNLAKERVSAIVESERLEVEKFQNECAVKIEDKP